MEVGLGVAWGDGFGHLCENLEDLKERAQVEGRESVFKCGDAVCLVRPTGFVAGGGKGSFHRYVLEWQGFVVSLVRRERPFSSTPNVRVSVGSEALTCGGAAEGCWRNALEFVHELGGEVLWNKLSRVDPCVDLPEQDVQELVDLVHAKHFIARANFRSVYSEGLRDTGAAFGKKTVRCRIYDKLLEVQKSPEKLAGLVQFRWGCKPKKAARVEFQLRREALKSFGIDSIEDYFAKRSLLVRYLCFEWLRLTAETVDRRHTLRAEVHSLWRTVQQAFSSWTGLEGGAVKRVKRVGGSTAALVAQGVGCLLSAICQESEGEIYDEANFLNAVINHARVWMLENTVGDAMADRIVRRSAAMPDWGMMPCLEMAT